MKEATTSRTAPRPTQYRPGTAEKVDVLAARFERHEWLHHPGDATNYNTVVGSINPKSSTWIDAEDIEAERRAEDYATRAQDRETTVDEAVSDPHEAVTCEAMADTD